MTLDTSEIREVDEERLAALRETLGRELKTSGHAVFEQALTDIGIPVQYGESEAGAVVLRPGDDISFLPRYGWAGPTLEDGHLVYTTRREGCHVWVHREDDTYERFPGNTLFNFWKDSKILVGDGVLGYPSGGVFEPIWPRRADHAGADVPS